MRLNKILYEFIKMAFVVFHQWLVFFESGSPEFDRLSVDINNHRLKQIFLAGQIGIQTRDLQSCMKCHIIIKDV